MSSNIDQIYTANPITTNQPTDLIYIGQSPYGTGDDAAINFENFAQQFQSGRLNYGTDSGSADLYVVTLVLSETFSPYPGMPLSFQPLNTNATQSPTVNVNGIGPVNIILPNGLQVVPGDLNASYAAYMVYEGGSYILLNPQISYVSAINIQNNTYTTAYDSGVAANAYIATLIPTPATSFYYEGLFILQGINATNTGSSTVTVNGNTLTIYLPTGNTLNGGELVQNTTYLFLVTNTSTAILLNSSLSAGSGASSVEVQQSAFNIGSDSGIADAYVVNLSPSVTSYTDGLIVSFAPANTNATTSPTLQVNSLSPVPMQYAGYELYAGDIYAGYLVTCQYISAGNYFNVLNPYVSVVAPAQVQQSFYNHGDDSGTADNYVIINLGNGNIPILTLNDGLQISFTPAHTNLTTSPTMTVSGCPVPIVKSTGAVVPGSLSTSMIAFCIYSTAANAFVLITPAL